MSRQKEKRKSLWKLPGRGETKSFSTAVSSGFTHQPPCHPPSRVHPRANQRPPACDRRLRVRNGPGVGKAGVARSCLREAERTLSVSLARPVLSCPRPCLSPLCWALSWAQKAKLPVSRPRPSGDSSRIHGMATPPGS